MTELVLGGHSLLVPRGGRDPMWWGAFVMAPWASLLKDAVETPSGVFRPPAGDDAWHGTARHAQWNEVGAGIAETELGAPWPGGGCARIRVTFDDSVLQLELSVTAGKAGMPAAVGWHPWFVREISGSVVQVHVDETTRTQERDGADAPTGRWVVPTRRWNDGVRTGPVTLEYPGVGSLRMRWSSPFAILFTESAQGVCVEPTTSPPERLEHFLAPGEELLLAIRLSWHAA